MKQMFLNPFLPFAYSNRMTASKPFQLTASSKQSKLKQRHIEPQVEIRFSIELSKSYEALHDKDQITDNYVGTSLGGQDWALSDFLAEANARFILIEFKDNEKLIRSEHHKKQRIPLAKQYLKRSALFDMGMQLHYIGWGTEHPVINRIDGSTMLREDIQFDRYPYRLCALFNEKISTSHSKERNLRQFLDAFLVSRQVGAGPERFERYIKELFRIAEEDAEHGIANLAGSVFVYLPAEDGQPPELISERFVGLEQLYHFTLGPDKAREIKESNERVHGYER